MKDNVEDIRVQPTIAPRHNLKRSLENVEPSYIISNVYHSRKTICAQREQSESGRPTVREQDWGRENGEEEEERPQNEVGLDERELATLITSSQ